MYDVNLTGIYLVSVMLAIILAQLGVFHRTILRSELILYLPPLPPRCCVSCCFCSLCSLLLLLFFSRFSPVFPPLPPPHCLFVRPHLVFGAVRLFVRDVNETKIYSRRTFC